MQIYLIYYVHSNIHAHMVTPEPRYTQIYKDLSYHLFVVRDAKHPARYNKKPREGNALEYENQSSILRRYFPAGLQRTG